MRAVKWLIGIAVLVIVGTYGASWIAVRQGCSTALDREDGALREVVDVGDVCTCAATGTLVRVKNPFALVEAAWWAWQASSSEQPGLTVVRALSPGHADDVATIARVLDAHRACLPPATELLPKLKQRAVEAREVREAAPSGAPTHDPKTGRLRRDE